MAKAHKAIPVRKSGSSSADIAVHFSKAFKRSAENELIANQPLTYEDQFSSLYTSAQSNKMAIQPPFNPETLIALCYANNTLLQCVQAMEVNIDGTGFTVEPVDQEKADREKKLRKWQEVQDRLANGPQDSEGKPIKLPPGSKTPESLKQPPVDGQDQIPGLPATKAFPPAGNGQKPPQDPAGQDPAGQNPGPEGIGATTESLPGAPGAEPPPDVRPPFVDPEEQMLKDFYGEPYPGMSMTTIRRALRFDLEMTGNGYLEVIRNSANDVVLCRSLESPSLRLVKLDQPVEVEVKIERSGKESTVSMLKRERRYVQIIGSQQIFYKEFGASRVLKRKEGDWAVTGETVPVDNMASEVIHFVVDLDYRTHYGMPRWINQMPSVVGSRKSELFNLDFFDAGGIPPAIIFIQGGSVVETMREQLLHYLSGGAKSKQRAAVVEAQSSSGSLDAAGKVDVKVERFGDSRQNDAMFQEYDKNAENRVRRGFRLHPLFLGEAQDYSFATAMTSYMVTEAQVFQPEREEFDEIINRTISRALGAFKFKMVSKPLTLRNIDAQLKGLEMGKDKASAESFMKDLNQVANLTLEYDPQAAALNAPPQLVPFAQAAVDGKIAPPKPAGVGVAVQPGVGSPVAGVKRAGYTATDLLVLANQWAEVMELDEPSREYSSIEKASILHKVDLCAPHERELLNQLLAAKTFPAIGRDPAGLAEIAACCGDTMMQ
jgi:PBSX family phage portal protein